MRRIGIVLLAFLFEVISVHAQWSTDQERQALQDRLDTCTEDKDRYRIVLDLASTWTLSGKAMPYLTKADSLFGRMLRDEHPAVREEAQGRRGYNLYLLGYQAKFHRDMTTALSHFREALRIHKESSTVPVAMADQDAIGLVYRAVGLPHQAVACFAEELRSINEGARGDVRLTTLAHLHLAQALADLEQWDRADHELALCDTLHPMDHASVLVERARVNDLRGDRAGARTLFSRAATIIARAPNEWDRIGVLQPKARFHMADGDAKAALATASECMRVAEERGDEAAWCGCVLIAGEARMVLGDEQGMERDLRSALDTARAYHYMGLSREAGDEGSMVHAAELLKDHYRSRGRIQEALEMTLLWAELKDTLHSMQGREELLRYDLQLETLKDSVANAQRIERATADYQRQLDEERQHRRVTVIGGSVALVTALITVAWYVERRRRKAHYERQQAVLEERLRIADDLHDDMGAGLSSLKLRSALALERANAPDQEEALRSLAGTADGLMDNMRQILWAMGTEHTQLADLVRYVTVYARQTLEEQGIALTVDVDGSIPVKDLNGLERRNIFLVAKEALHNVVKHAQAKQVRIAFRWKGGLEMHVQDDGTGTATLDATKGNGMRTMRKRANALGGTIDLVTALGEGTTIRLYVPFGTTLNKRPIAMATAPADLRIDG